MTNIFIENNLASSHSEHPKYRSDIDGLRAIAILSVVGFHAFPTWIQGGFIGVDIFFVISGYLISTIIFTKFNQNSFKFIEFYSRRIKRIFPALLLVLSASFVFGWFMLLSDEYKQLSKHIAGAAGFISNLILWNESGYFDNFAETKPLLHLWSLGIEEQFYIAWPLLLWVIWKLRLNLLTITVIVVVISFTFNVYQVHHNVTAAFYSPQTRFWELLAGTLLAYITLRQKMQQVNSSARNNIQSLLGFFLVSIGIIFITKDKLFPGWWALLPTIGAVLIIAAGPHTWLNRAVLSNRVLVWFGLISFPLYLWHWPLLSFVRIIEGEIPGIEIRFAVIVISIALAWMTFKFIEIPIRFGSNGQIKTITLLILMILIFCLGYISYKKDGLIFKATNSDFKITPYDWVKGYRHQNCFINAVDATSNSFADFCSSYINGKNKTPMIMLWGDSHAASIYRGLLKQTTRFGYDITQYTASGCPPILNFKVDKRKECEGINSFVLEQIKRQQPDTLILAAFWSMYDGKSDDWNLLEDQNIDATITLLKSLNIKNIYILGHLPTFKSNQSSIAANVFVANKIDRTFKRFNFSIIESNKRMELIAKNNNVKFISPLDLLCDGKGCLISTSSQTLIPLAWDYGHLTEAGSEFLIAKAVEKNLISFSK